MNLYSLKFYDDGSKSFGPLTSRQERLVRGAVLYNSLIQPGRSLTYKVYFGGSWKYPRLTDLSTLNGLQEYEFHEGSTYVFEAKSLVEQKSVYSPHYYEDDQPVIDSGVRYIALTPDDAVDDDAAIGREYTLKERFYRELETAQPVLLDGMRDITRNKRIHESKLQIERAEGPCFDWANRISKRPLDFIAPGEPAADSPQAVIVAMHWLQAGGAERWGMETIRLVKDAGMVPIVITSIDSHQPWITDPLLEDVPVINLTFPTQDRPGDEPLLRALFEQYNVRGVLIHHSQWMYDRLWWVKKYFPEVKVVDTLHILEYRWHGGFPVQAVRFDNFIDLHHVISPQLVEWLTKTQKVDASKVVDAPLAGLTADENSLSFKTRRNDDQLSLAFVGRMNRQKRPDAFILLVERLNKLCPGKFRFILHGSGDIDAVVESLLDSRGLREVVEWRTIDVPVSKTYEDADILVVSSVNEGITLTTFEALSAGIPVISTDVGSQKTLIPEDALLGMSTRTFLSRSTKLLKQLLSDEASREDLWRRECDMMNEFSALESASSLFARLLGEWKRG